MKIAVMTRTASALVALLAATALSPVYAQEGGVVAKVGSATVTEEELKLAEADFAAELGQIPEERRRAVLIDVLVDMELLAQAARDKGLDKTEDFQKRAEFLQTRALRNAFVENEIVTAVTPEEVKAEYDRQLKTFEPQQEIRARHILVDTKEAADKIIADLNGGASFEELAKQSKDGSGQNGGDLGFFSRGQMVPQFEEAAFALEPGKMTEAPVQSQFGWHVIKVEEKRMSAPPPLEEVEEQLRNVVLRQKFETVMSSLRDKYPVEIVGAPAGEAPAAAPESQPAAPDAQPAPEAAPAPAQQ
jgi:peptidyl-prolyl cis-trans isomerase C